MISHQIVAFSASCEASFMFIIINLGLLLVVIPVLRNHSFAMSNIGRQSVTPPDMSEKLNMWMAAFASDSLSDVCLFL